MSRKLTLVTALTALIAAAGLAAGASAAPPEVTLQVIEDAEAEDLSESISNSIDLPDQASEGGENGDAEDGEAPSGSDGQGMDGKAHEMVSGPARAGELDRESVEAFVEEAREHGRDMREERAQAREEAMEMRQEKKELRQEEKEANGGPPEGTP